MLGDLPLLHDDRVLVDFRTADDAGVYAWGTGAALVQTVDFFTPIVDDPYAYGQIAAANALSDVYAMGGVPRTALAIAALPVDGPSREDIRLIFRGGFDMLQEARVALLGGHTVRDQEIKFGYAITGEIDPARIFTNSHARVGDELILTKAIGTGIITTAIKSDRATSVQTAAAVASMRQLNRRASEIMRAREFGDVSSCTDVTGFALLGHASEMASASQVTMIVRAGSVPFLPGALELVETSLPGGGKTNQAHFGQNVVFDQAIAQSVRLAMFDPQTSGGLLIAVRKDRAIALHAELCGAGLPATIIGTIERPDPAGILVRVIEK